MTAWHDSTYEEVGAALCKLQVFVQEVDNPEFSIRLTQSARIVESWLQHPRNRNWSLVQEIEAFIK